jgi:4-alpha-glucanotransferase
MRRSGILMHPTSLPGEFGIGELGVWAYRFADFLSEGGQQLWQILPLGPTGFGYSPYQTYSSMAGNPLLISLQTLVDQGWLGAQDLRDSPGFPADRVDFNAVIPFKKRLIRKAAAAFFQKSTGTIRNEFERFCSQESFWLEDFATFAALKGANGESPWTRWDPDKKVDVQEQRYEKFIQFEFFRQWKELKLYCSRHGIQIIGDIPIFVSHDSADVWTHPELFDLDAHGNPNAVAGVPPDYFSETGQRWGNPLYRWDVMERQGYRWWIERVQSVLKMVDLIRLDHFRGFEKFWRIPFDSETAVAGSWVEGPGDRIFQALRNALGELPLIAEDLGLITPEVHALRERWGFPGMRILQFAFGDSSPDHPYKPHNFIKNCVVYTGTHDNDTSAGWFADISDAASRARRDAALLYMDSVGENAVWDFIRLALASVADTAIVPMQDVLGLGSAARMNVPSTIANNWQWRMRGDELKPGLAKKLRDMNRLYGRLPR